MAIYELKSDALVTGRGRMYTPEGVSTWEHDNAHLRQIGKKPVLKRSFGILSIFGFSCTLLGTWEGLLGTFVGPLKNGGSGGTVYAFIFGWAPTAGGQYHWAAMLAPIKYQKFLSFMTGWWAVLGWQTALASSAFLTGTMIQGAAILGNSLYDSLPWQGTLIIWATLLCALLVNLAGGRLLPRIETVLLVVHVLGFFGIMITLTYMSDHKSKEEVFLQFENNGGFDSQGLSWFVGMTSCAFGFAGGDAAVHMSEEVANAPRVIPRALMLSVLVNGCLGFGMLLALLFCAGNLEAALNSRTGYPFMEIFYEATNSLAVSLLMCSIVLVFYCCSLMGLLAAASRQIWSFSRDKGVPGWHFWNQVSSSRGLPINSIILTVIISGALALINIGSSVALDDVVSMAVSGLYLSYLMVCILLLYRRTQGNISRHNESEDDLVNVPGARLAWGTFHCPGIWGTFINVFAILYIFIVVFFSFWPSEVHPSVESMNWSVVGIGGSSILAVVYYFAYARHIYVGPVMETSK
ncbi:amino acid permease [Penicillium odoratum]|uniref:amino acid permease n=1 Tax=Penicillium odoratum TaxID=1167516 RepID=UPI0025468D1B|nr:amino acid permease [Penicillium odoratum]KAJ5751561.1 amino acid permease [Penicillium odoratum]